MIFMDIEQVKSWVLGVLEILSIAVTSIHVYRDIKKSHKGATPSTSFHPSFRTNILMLLTISGLLLLLVKNSNPHVFSLFWSNKTIISKGIVCTVEVSLLSILFGTILGVIVALAIAVRKSNVWYSLIDSALYSGIYILLGIPALVLLFLFYYGPTKTFPVFWSSVIALSVNLAPFVAKIVIASIQNIAQEQLDSAKSFGYTYWQRFWYFQVLYVVKSSSQPLLVEYYTTIKLSSLAGIFSLYETYHATLDIVTNTYDTVNAYIILAICYVLIVTWIAILADYLDKKWRLSHGD